MKRGVGSVGRGLRFVPSGWRFARGAWRFARSGAAVVLAVVLAVGLGAMLVAGCGGDDDDDGPTNPGTVLLQDFLPAEVGGFATEGNPLTATTPEGLYDIINGGSELYVSHNFQDFVQQVYTGQVAGAQATLTAWIFEVATTADCQALYEDENLPSSGCQDYAEVGEDARFCRSFGPLLLLFRRDVYFIYLQIDSNSNDAEDVIKLMSAHIDQEMTR